MAGYSGKMHFQFQPVFFIKMVTDQADCKPHYCYNKRHNNLQVKTS